MSKRHEDIVNKDIILFALYELGGAREPVHTEDVAYQVVQYPIGRQKYCWEKYAEYPDKGRIARELRRLKKWNGQSYVKGHVNIGAHSDRIDGWLLTAAGVERVKGMEKELRVALEAEAPIHSVYRVEELNKRITGTTCYKLYQKNPSLANAKEHDFTDMLYCLPDASTDKIRSAFDVLLGHATAVNADDMVEFLKATQVRFFNLLEK